MLYRRKDPDVKLKGYANGAIPKVKMQSKRFAEIFVEHNPDVDAEYRP